MDSSPEGCKNILLEPLKLNKRKEVSTTREKLHLSKEGCKNERKNISTN